MQSAGQLAAARGVAGMLLRSRPLRLTPAAPPPPPTTTPPRLARRAAHASPPSSCSPSWSPPAAPPPAPLSLAPRHLLPIVHHPLFSGPRLPSGHRFPMQVFGAIHSALLSSGLAAPEQICAPGGDGHWPTDDELSLVHTREYLQALSSGELDAARARRIGFGADAFSGEAGALLLRRTRSEAAGTFLAARLALERGLCTSTAGGTHHAHADSGSGFCVVNDLAYTAARLVIGGEVGRVAIVDLDVHQGDGTAGILEGGEEEGQAGLSEGERTSDDGGRRSGGRTEGGGNGGGGGGGGAAPAQALLLPPWVRERVFTLSVHARNNFPARKRRSTLDVALPDGCGDGDYLSAVAEALEQVMAWLQLPLPPAPVPAPAPAENGSALAAATAAAASPTPKKPALVLFDAGVDTHADDALGRLSLTDDGLRRRELLVLDTFLAAGVPVAGFTGGGYHADLGVLAERHLHLHRAALRMWREYGLGEAGLAAAAAAAATEAAAAVL